MMVINIGLSLLLGSIFLVSSIPKLRHPKGFVFTVLNYRVLPPSLSTVYALVVPSLECFIGLCLLMGALVCVDGGIIALLLTSYLIAVSVNMARGRALECNCFGALKRRHIGWGLVIQDSVLLLLALAVSITSSDGLGLASWSLFRLAGLASAQSVFPLFICIGLILSSMLFFFIVSREKRKKFFPTRIY